MFVKLCEEDRRPEDEGMCGKFSVLMYGTCNCGFRLIREKKCTFRQQERNIVVMAHGDDFASTADIEDLRWLESMFKEKF